MEYLFLIILFIIFLVLESVLDNILWIGAIVIILIGISIIRAFNDYKEFGFDFNDFMILLLKLAAIAGVVYLMCV
ncbi:MAG: hypothetical protein J6B22_03830 [Clostridia bacterium]|nr:hypothetical protein [Clostridia bacterium]